MKLPTLLARLQSLKIQDPSQLWQQADISRRAGVLVLLSPLGPNDFEVLLTVRAKNISFGGDPAFPGGKADHLDEDPQNVALREAKEEINLDLSQVQFVKTMPGYVSSRLHLVVPSIVYSPHPVDTRKFNTDEVHKIFKVPLSRFLSNEGYASEQRKMSGKKLRINYFDILAADKKVGDPMYDRVWGLTAKILVDCAQLILQRKPEFEFFRLGGKLTNDEAEELGNMGILKSLAKDGVLQKPVRSHKL